MAAGNSAPTLQYLSHFEPAPLPNESVFNAVWDGARFPDRTDYRRKRPVAEGMTAVIPQAAVDLVTTQKDWNGQHADRVPGRKRPVAEGLFAFEPFTPVGLVATQYDWRGAHADSVARRKRPVGEGLFATDALLTPVTNVTTGKYWSAIYPDHVYGRKRPVGEGLFASEPQKPIDDVATGYYWRGGHADAVARRRRPVGEGLLGADPFASLHSVAEDVTSDKWTGHWQDWIARRRRATWEGLGVSETAQALDDVLTKRMWSATYPDTIDRRKRATWEGIEAFEPQTPIDLAVLYGWRPLFADAVARRRRASWEGLLGTDFLEANTAPPETITMDKWAGRWPDRLYRKRGPVSEGGSEAEDLIARFDVGLYRWTPTFPDRAVRKAIVRYMADLVTFVETPTAPTTPPGPSYTSPVAPIPRRRRPGIVEIRSDGAVVSLRFVVSSEGQVEARPVVATPVVVPVKKRQLIVASASVVQIRVRLWVGRPRVEPQDDPDELRMLGLLD